MLKLDVAVYHTERDQMLFSKQYLVGNGAAAWDQYCVRHPEVGHTWVAMRELLYSQVAPTKYRTNAAFQQLHLAKLVSDQTVMSFGVYIVTNCKDTVITDYNKRMFFWTRLCLEICVLIRKGEVFLTFDACFEAGVEA